MNQISLEIDFGNDVKRKYILSESVSNAIFSGKHSVVELADPSHAEICCIGSRDCTCDGFSDDSQI